MHCFISELIEDNQIFPPLRGGGCGGARGGVWGGVLDYFSRFWWGGVVWIIFLNFGGRGGG